MHKQKALADQIAIRMGDQTTLNRASSKIDSLRTTVPKSIVNFMKLKDGDKFDWELQPQGNKFIIIIS